MTNPTQENTDTLHFGASMALPAERTAEQARLMEELGFEYMGAGEHFMRGRPPGPTHAALPLLAVAAGATERITAGQLGYAGAVLPSADAGADDGDAGHRIGRAADAGRGGGRRVSDGVRKRRHRHSPAGTKDGRMPGRAASAVDGGQRNHAGAALHAGRGGDQSQADATAASAGMGGWPAGRGHAPGSTLRGRLAAVLLQPGTLPGQHYENRRVRR